MRINLKYLRFQIAIAFLLISISIIGSIPPGNRVTILRVNVIPQQPTGSQLFKEYNLSTAQGGPEAIIADPSNSQRFWFTEFNGSKIGEIYANGTTHEFAINQTIEKGAEPATLAFDHQGRIWFADQKFPGSIWRFSPSTLAFKQYLTPTPSSSPVSIIIDSSDNVWFTERTAGRIGEFPSGSTSSSSMIEWTTPTSGSGPTGMVAQNGTSYLWITESYANKIARFDMRKGSFEEFAPSMSLNAPVGIVVDGSGDVWTSEHGGNSVAELVPGNSTFRKYPTSPGSTFAITGPATVSIDKLGRLWFVEHYANNVGLLDPKLGTMDEFAIPAPGQAYSLLNTLDSKGNFWFTEYDADQIGMINGTASFPAQILANAPQIISTTAGLTSNIQFRVSNGASNPVSLSTGVTSTFRTDYQTTPSEMSLNVSSLTLNPGETRIINALVTPDAELPAGVYAVGLVLSSGKSSTLSDTFLQVQANLWYQLESILPEILGVASIVFVGAFILLRRRKKRRSTPSSGNAAKISIVSVVTLFLLLSVGAVGTASAKCPGLPPPPGNPNGSTAPDYYGIALDIGSIAFFAIVAYLLIRERLHGRDTPV